MRRGLIGLGLVAVLAGCGADLDLQVPRSYPCERGTAETCPSGMRCGLEGSCHPEGVAAAYRCEQDTDCEASWRCGLEGVCHDRGVAAAYRCGADTDCEQGWQCGLEGSCHDPSVAAAYRCQSDLHCEQGWRCGVDGRCLDASADALRPHNAGTLQQRRVSPLVFGSPPEQLGANAGLPAAFTLIQAGQLTHVLHDPYGLSALDGGVPAALDRIALPAGTTPLAMVSSGTRTYVLGPDRVDRYSWSPAGGTYSALVIGTTGDRLRLTGQSAQGAVHPEKLLVLTANSYRYIFTSNGATSAVQTVPNALGAAQPIHDLIGFNGAPDALVAATDEGLFLRTGDGSTYGAWQAWAFPQLPNLRCGDSMSSGFRPVAFRARNGLGFAVLAVPLAASEPAVPHLSGLAYFGNIPSTCNAVTLEGNPLNQTIPFCPACPAGETLVDFGMLGNYQLHSRCQRALADGGTDERTWQVSHFGACGLQDPYPSYVPALNDRVWQGNAGLEDGLGGGGVGFGFGFAGAHGQLWDSSSSSSAGDNILPVTVAAPPDLVVLDRDAGLVVLSGVEQGTPVTARELAGIGLVQGFPDGGEDRVVGGVTGQPSWVVRRHFQDSENWLELWDAPAGGALLARTARTQRMFQPPFQAAVARAADGGTYALVASRDVLLAAELGPQLAALEPRDVPRPGSPILSLAPLPPTASPFLDGGTPLVQGYALTPNGLFRFSALTAFRWRSDDLPLPRGAWSQVWTDGDHARLGYQDGRVFSLPSRVQLSPEIPGGVGEFAVLCGQPFAVGPGGVRRLEPDPQGGPIGVWVEQPVEGLTGAVDPGWEGARLVSLGSGLYLFNRYGETYRLATSGGCP